MKKFTFLFRILIIFVILGLLTSLFFTKTAYAIPTCFTINKVEGVNVPNLPSPRDTIIVNVKITNDCGYVDGNGYVLALYFNVGGNSSFFNPSASSYTLPRSLYDGESLEHTFSTTVQSGNSCTTTGSKVQAIAELSDPRRPDFDKQITSQWVSQSLGGIGATMKVHVKKPDGTDVPDNTRIDLTGTYSDTKYTSGGYVTFYTLDCGVSHTITAYWNNQTARKSGISVNGGSGYFICNGQERTIDLQFPAPSPSPSSSPSPSPSSSASPSPSPSPPASTVSLISSCGPPSLSASWNRGPGSTCNAYIQAGSCAHQLKTDCTGSWSGTQLPDNGNVNCPRGLWNTWSGTLKVSNGTDEISDSETISCTSSPPPPPPRADCAPNKVTMTITPNPVDVGNQITFSVSGTDNEGSTYIGDTWTPANGLTSLNCGCTQVTQLGNNCGIWGRRNCIAAAATSYTWTHYWSHDINNRTQPQCSKTATYTINNPIRPWIQVTGDVHSNTGIYASGGP